jgi:ADP-ribosylglycohydrolase
MLNRNDLINNRALSYDKALGAMAGLAIGDSFGDASRKQDNQLTYGITTDFNKEASWSTDDTEFSLLTAKMLIECEGNLSSEEVVKGWMENVVSQNEFPRGGASEIQAARNLKRGILPPYSGEYNSYHNSDGAAMRTAPIGIICAGDSDRAVELANIDASISHFREGIWGAQAVAVAVSIAMVDGTIDEIIEAALKSIPEDSWLYYSMKKALKIVDNANGEFMDAWMPLHDELWTSYKASVPEAVAAAFGLLKLVNKDFKTGVVAAGNFGRDADTIAAIVGAILGAKYGFSQMPERWVEKTRYPSGTCLSFTKGLDIKEVAQRLSDLII